MKLTGGRKCHAAFFWNEPDSTLKSSFSQKDTIVMNNIVTKNVVCRCIEKLKSDELCGGGWLEGLASYDLV